MGRGKKPGKGHDRGYRLLFSHREMVEDLLRHFVREPWLQELDFSSLEPVPGSYVSDHLEERTQDVVWRVRWRKRWLYLYLLIEFQSTVDRYMAVRVLAYVALLYQELIRRGELSDGGLLPQVLPIVLYNGSRPWSAAQDVFDLIAVHDGGMERYLPRLAYVLIDEERLPPGEVQGVRSLTAALFRLERSRDPEEVRQVLGDLTEWLQSPGAASLRRAFLAWLRGVLLPGRMPGVEIPEVADLKEFGTMLSERVIEWTQQWKTEGFEKGLRRGFRKGVEEGRKVGVEEGRKVGVKEGIKEGIREGIKEGIKEGISKGARQGESMVLLRLLERKFGTLDPGTQARIESAREERILSWVDRVLTARSLEEVFSEPGEGRP